MENLKDKPYNIPVECEYWEELWALLSRPPLSSSLHLLSDTLFFFLSLDINYHLDFSFHFTTVKAKIALDKPKQTRKTLVKDIATGEKDQNCVLTQLC